MNACVMKIVVQVLAFLSLACPAVVHGQTTVKYVHTDALGSVVAMTNASGAVVEKTREYEPYGQRLTPALQDGPGYTGHVQDAATGLVYMQQRYYDPAIGRFLSVDPVTTDPSNGVNFNRYNYAANNPYKFTDPDGRLPIAVAACAATPWCAAAAVASVAYVGYQVTKGIKELAAYAEEAGGSDNGGSNESGSDGSSAPPLPEVLVGGNPKVRGSGGSATSDPLAPEHGGSGGDYDADLGTLAGETRRAGPGDPAPAGAQIGANGVFGREENSSGGRSIDIPANGDKPHETLHYPPREKQ